MGIAPESSRYTAFNTCFGTYKFLRLPMGLSTASNSFQLLMDKVLHGLTFRSALCYLDDVIICSDTFHSHMKDLADLFERFEMAGLKLNPSKCSFAQQKCTFLGHVISKDGLSAPPDRVEAIQRYPVPSSVSALRRFLGMVGWFRKYIPNFSSIADPLFFLLKIAYPRFDLQFRIAVDTSRWLHNSTCSSVWLQKLIQMAAVIWANEA